MMNVGTNMGTWPARHPRRMRVVTRFCLLALATGLFCPAAVRADKFGDITVAPQMMHDGNTQHGYAETRVLLQNAASAKPHRVTLTFPNEPARYGGNALRQITLTVTLAPGDRVLKTLWQLPLPVNGDCRLRVEVDNEAPEFVNFPGGNHHMSSGMRGYGPPMPSTVLVSRDLNFDSVSRAFKSDGKAFTAMMATGAPDSSGRTGNPVPTTWMPSPSQTGTNWLELGYGRTFQCDRVRLFQTMAVLQSGELVLIGESGTNLLRMPLSEGKSQTPTPGMGRGSGRGMGWRTMREFTFPLTVEPVKRVRIEFPSSPANSINIDAVELSGSSDSVFADEATASSDAVTEAARWAVPGVGAGNEQALPLRAEFPVAEWSPNWLAYTPYDVIAISGTEMKALPPEVAEAVWRYTEAGGNLFIVGGEDSMVPPTWRAGWRHQTATFTAFNVGFGRCFCAPTEDFTRLSSDAAQILRNAVGGTTRYWQTLPGDVDSANNNFPVIENLTMPTRGIVILMLSFIIVIGPVNFFVLNRMKRRLWMLWTIPVISFATCGVVFIFSLLREGNTPDTRIRSLTVLDQNSRRATSIGAEAFYCPLTPGNGLTFDFETEVTPLVRLGYGGNDNGRTVDLTTAQHLDSGWVSARVPAHFHLRKSETRRERLQLERSGGQLSVINGLGAAVKTLWFADTDGKIYSANNVGAGDRMTLLASTRPNAGNNTSPSLLLADATYTAKDDVLAEPNKYLKPGCYLAELEGNPFLENGLGKAARAKRTRASALVFGVMEVNP